MWIADVGQGAVEELTVMRPAQQKGADLGWRMYEGTAATARRARRARRCPAGRAAAQRRLGSVTGGHVYRGSASPDLAGWYFYGDYCGGWIRSLVRRGGAFEVTQWFPPGTVTGLTGFGVDGDGELYVTSVDGSVYRIEQG